MSDVRLSELVEQFSLLHRGSDPELAAVAVAIAVEDSLGVRIADDVLDDEHLGTPEAMVALLRSLEHG